MKQIEYGDELKLDTTMTSELKLEGLTAELTRQIQSQRKETGLKVGQMAELRYETDSAIIEKAMQRVDRKKTYLNSVKRKAKSEKQEGKEISIDGQKLLIILISN